ncbi:MAG: metallophosphoesterase [Candidatus Thorarchaeota archaeon]
MKLVQDIIDGKTDLSVEEIVQLTGMVVDLYKNASNVVEIPSYKVLFVGDLHGELKDLKSVQKMLRTYKDYSMVFLGDYADRGPAQLDTFNLVMALTLNDPDRVTMLRGNHESDSIASKYGFFWEIMKTKTNALCQNFNKVFEVLPIAGMSDNGIFACHGGIPENVSSLQDIQKPNRQYADFPNDTLFQIVWNDPEDKDFDFRPNCRSKRARIFGRKAFDQFRNDLEISLMVRAHQVFREGVKYFFDKKLVSIFTAGSDGEVTPKVLRVGKEFKMEAIQV